MARLREKATKWEIVVDDFLSEREQIDEIKSVVRQNAPWAIAGILLGVIGLIGYQQWNAWLDRQAVTASQKYAAVIDALSQRDVTTAIKLVDELNGHYARTPYADVATLVLARFDVETGKLDDAARLLKQVADTARDADLKNVASLRLARVQRAAHQYDAALATLAKAPTGDAAAPFLDVRGDVLLDKGDKAGALTAWREALSVKTPGLINRELVELKAKALGGSFAASASSTDGTSTVTSKKP